MATTVRDVAEEAGVSPMTVSKVLHNRGANVRVSEQTAQRVREAAAKLGYQPNNLARSFRTRRTDTVGLFYQYIKIDDHKSGYFLKLMAGVTQAAFEHEISVTICPKLLTGREKPLGDGRFDGLVWCTVPTARSEARALLKSGVPVVFMHAPKDSLPGASTFCCDNYQGLDLGVSHLRGLGHKSIAFVIDPFNKESIEGVERQAAFRSACKNNDVDGRILTWDENCEELIEWYREPDHETALITFSEVMGGAILDCCAMHGISVPHDLSVVGYDSTQFCELTVPKLTAISQPVEQMAYDATKKLFLIIDSGDQPAEHLSYRCGLDVRESTAPPPLQS
jgi:LacI family transcriptional regulator